MQSIQDKKREKPGFIHIVSILLSCILGLFLGYVLIRYKWYSYVIKGELTLWSQLPALIVTFVCCIFLFIVLYRRLKTANTVLILICVFMLALIPRLTLRFCMACEPISDFKNYYDMGVAFTSKDYATVVSIVNEYGIPDFYGLAVIYGVILSIFGESTYALQFACCCNASLITVIIALIAMRYSKKAGLAAGLIYAIYPGNVIMAQVATNQHVAILFALVSVYFVMCATDEQRGIWISVAFAGIGGLCLLVSQYSHPSSITTQIAVASYLIVLVIGSVWNWKRMLCIAAVAVMFFGCFYVTKTASTALMRSSGYMGDTSGFYQDGLFKIVTGMNPETEGGYSDQISALDFGKTPEERKAYAWNMLKEFWPTRKGLLTFFDAKVRRVWLGKDDLNWWCGSFFHDISKEWSNGTESLVADQMAEHLRTFIGAYIYLDFFFVAGIYVFALLGILFRRRGKYSLDLVVWALLGWVSVHLFIEIMQRYRYYGITMFIVFAGVGISEIPDALRALTKRVKQKRPEVSAKANEDIADLASKE